jgi:homoserine acetyltransferase
LLTPVRGELAVKTWQMADVGMVVGGDYKKALEGVTARVLITPSESDQFLDVENGRDLKNGRFEPIKTIWGHIAVERAELLLSYCFISLNPN